MRKKYLSLYILLLALPGIAWAEDPMQHDMVVNILPQTGQIHVIDTITIPESLQNKSISFWLNSNLKLVNSSIALKPLETNTPHSDLGIYTKKYRVSLPSRQLSIEYSGQIQNKLGSVSKEYAQSFQETAGIINEQGVFLASSSAWYPLVEDYLVSFKMKISLPQDWTAISQGARIDDGFENQLHKVSWQEQHAQDDIYIVAGPYQEYHRKDSGIDAMVYLHDKDEELANTYLDATFRYIKMYQNLIGDYPYKKFALVENFWESGYGMPSFTLLGPRIIRFPFILYTSYPHEILHNWWGNGVFVDYSGGNWAEGLTAYLSDHMLKAQQGQGSNYRRDVLQKYTDFVQEEKDFPLRNFQARHSTASEAIGYGKTLMLFHMLRVELGDDTFKKVLRELYRTRQFTTTSFEDVRRVFDRVTGKNWAGFFNQWVTRPGAAQLKLSKTTMQKVKKGFQTTFDLTQIQKGQALELLIPVALWYQGEAAPHVQKIRMTHRRQSFTLQTDKAVAKIHIDPKFDVFRRLDPSEIPAALSQGYGAPEKLVVIPSQASDSMRQAYQQLATDWASSQPGHWTIKQDNEIDKLPLVNAVWVLGWENKFLDQIESSTIDDLTFKTIGISKGNETFKRNERSVVLATDNKRIRNQTLLWIGTDNIAAVSGLSRKLPHYKKYGLLVFEGDEPQNILKSQWQTKTSPLIFNFSKTTGDILPVADRKALAPSVWR